MSVYMYIVNRNNEYGEIKIVTLGVSIKREKEESVKVKGHEVPPMDINYH